MRDANHAKDLDPMNVRAVSQNIPCIPLSICAKHVRNLTLD